MGVVLVVLVLFVCLVVYRVVMLGGVLRSCGGWCIWFFFFVGGCCWVVGCDRVCRLFLSSIFCF